MEDTAQGTRPRPLLPAPGTGLIQGNPGFTSPPWVFKVMHFASECRNYGKYILWSNVKFRPEHILLWSWEKDKNGKRTLNYLGKHPSPSPLDYYSLPDPEI